MIDDLKRSAQEVQVSARRLVKEQEKVATELKNIAADLKKARAVGILIAFGIAGLLASDLALRVWR